MLTLSYLALKVCNVFRHTSDAPFLLPRLPKPTRLQQAMETDHLLHLLILLLALSQGV